MLSKDTEEIVYYEINSFDGKKDCGDLFENLDIT